jgi:hypothetical protein
MGSVYACAITIAFFAVIAFTALGIVAHTMIARWKKKGGDHDVS